MNVLQNAWGFFQDEILGMKWLSRGPTEALEAASGGSAATNIVSLKVLGSGCKSCHTAV